MEDRFKFRAWHKRTKAMIYIDAIMFANDSYMAHTHDGWSSGGPLSDIILLQCTGKKDKNGKLIFEGDLLGNKLKAAAIVVYENGKFGYRFFFMEEDSELIDLDPLPYDTEIKGNIYENPELLNS